MDINVDLISYNGYHDSTSKIWYNRNFAVERNFQAASASSSSSLTSPFLPPTLRFIGASISGISDAPRGICTEIPGNFRKVVRVLRLSISARHMSAAGNSTNTNSLVLKSEFSASGALNSPLSPHLFPRRQVEFLIFLQQKRQYQDSSDYTTNFLKWPTFCHKMLKILFVKCVGTF